MYGVNIIDNVNELPILTDYNDSDKTKEKLIVFDDVINLKKSEKEIIQKWFNSCRKYGFTAIIMAQNYSDVPIQIRRNIMIWVLFKQRDIRTIDQILKNHNSNGDSLEETKQAYYYATQNQKDFFKIDLTEDGPYRYTHNFIDAIPINKD